MTGASHLLIPSTHRFHRLIFDYDWCQLIAGQAVHTIQNVPCDKFHIFDEHLFEAELDADQSVPFCFPGGIEQPVLEVR